MHFVSKYKKNSQGITLVVALLVLSLAGMTIMLLTKLITLQLKSSLNSVNSIGAYYVSESGIEQSLYYLQYARNNNNFVDNFDRLEQSGFNLVNLANGGEYHINIASTTASRSWDFFDISTSSPQHIDIIDPAGNIDTIAWHNQPSSLNYIIQWGIDSCFPNHASSRLETKIYSFEANFANPKVDTKVDICNCAYGSSECDNISYSLLDRNRYYRFTFRPLDTTVNDFNFSMSDVGIKSAASIEVDGVYRSSNYRLKVQLPALSPSSDIFSYVIFSEEDLTKGF